MYNQTFRDAHAVMQLEIYGASIDATTFATWMSNYASPREIIA